MFWVNGNQEERHAKINSFLNEEEAVIAVLLAAADLEWTIRRVIIALSKKPNVDVREQILKNCSSIKKYKEAWKSEVTPDFEKTLPEIIPDWDYFYKDAYPLRHKLIHGVEGTTGLNYARTRVNSILAAAKAIADFAKENKDIDIYNRLPVRRRSGANHRPSAKITPIQLEVKDVAAGEGSLKVPQPVKNRYISDSYKGN